MNCSKLPGLQMNIYSLFCPCHSTLPHPKYFFSPCVRLNAHPEMCALIKSIFGRITDLLLWLNEHVQLHLGYLGWHFVFQMVFLLRLGFVQWALKVQSDPFQHTSEDKKKFWQ